MMKWSIFYTILIIVFSVAAAQKFKSHFFTERSGACQKRFQAKVVNRYVVPPFFVEDKEAN